MMLNGWQRLGVVLSVLWLLIALFFDPFEITIGGITVRKFLAIVLLQILAFWVSAYAALFAFRWVRKGFLGGRKPVPSVGSKSVPTQSQIVSDTPANISLPKIKPHEPAAQPHKRFKIWNSITRAWKDRLWRLLVLILRILASWVSAVLFAFRWVRKGFLGGRKPVPSVDYESVVAPAQAPVEPIPPAATKAVSDLERAVFRPIKPFVPNKRQFATSIAATIILSLLYWGVFIDALAGEFNAKQSIGVCIAFSALAFRHFWQCLNRRGWVGALVGVAISLLVFFLGASISGYVKGQPDYILEHAPIFAAIKKSYPEDYEKILQSLVAKAHDKNMSREELLAQWAPIAQPILRRVLRTTSDEALLQFGRGKVQMYQEVAASNADDCLSMMLVRSDSASQLQSQLRIMASLSKKTNDAMSDANLKVFNAAGSLKAANAVKDPIRFEALFEQLDATLTSTYGTSAYYLSDDSLNKPAEVRCKAGLLLFKEVLNLPPQDRSFMLRQFFGGE